jgi:hypothetical protein
MVDQLLIPSAEKSPATEQKFSSQVSGESEEKIDPQRIRNTQSPLGLRRFLERIPIYLSVFVRVRQWRKLFSSNGEQLPDAA